MVALIRWQKEIQHFYTLSENCVGKFNNLHGKLCTFFKYLNENALTFSIESINVYIIQVNILLCLVLIIIHNGDENFYFNSNQMEKIDVKRKMIYDTM